MSHTKRTTKPAAGAAPADSHGYRPITASRADVLGNVLGANLQDDELTHALVELLEGLVAAAFGDRLDAETLASVAAWRAYSNTMHFSRAYDDFRNGPPLDLEEFTGRNRRCGGAASE